MKKLLFLTAALLTSNVTAATVGEQAPHCALTSLNNVPAHFHEYAGKVLYVDFWASWCSSCLQSFPFLNQLAHEFGDQGLHIVGVNLDEQIDDAHAFLAHHPSKFTITNRGGEQCAKSFNVGGDVDRALLEETQLRVLVRPPPQVSERSAEQVVEPWEPEHICGVAPNQARDHFAQPPRNQFVGVENQDPIVTGLADREGTCRVSKANTLMEADGRTVRSGNLDRAIVAVHVANHDLIGPLTHRAQRVRQVALFVERVDDD